MSEPEAAPKLKAAAMKAVELDDGFGEGHSELGDYYLARAWDLSAAAPMGVGQGLRVERHVQGGDFRVPENSRLAKHRPVRKSPIQFA